MQQTGSRAMEIPIYQKYTLSIREASAYFGIGMKKMRRMAEDNEGGFTLWLGNRFLIYRPAFEEYLRGKMQRAEKIDEED